MNNKALKWLNTLLLFFIMVHISYAQKIEPVYSRKVQYTIIKGKPKYADKKQAALIKSSLSNIRYALDHYFGEKIWYKNEIRVEQCNIKFYIQETDSLITTVYSIGFKQPLEGRILNEYQPISFPPTIIPEDDYLLWKDPTSVIIISVYFNAAAFEGSEDYIRKQKKLKLVQDWIKDNSTE